MPEKVANRFLAVIKIGQQSPTLERLRETIPAVKDALRRFSIDDLKLAFSSHDGSTFGLLFKSKYHPSAICSALTASSYGTDHTAVILNDDNLLVVEVGELFSGFHFSRAWTWLQHN
jgi:hypothetical protein